MHLNLRLDYKIIIMMTLTTFMLVIKSMLLLWLIMEINNIIFLVISMKSSHLSYKNSPSPIIIMIQFLSSSIMIGGVCLENSTMLSVGVMMKMGLFPFHSWVPMIMFNLSTQSCLIFMTLQKIPPILFIQNFNSIIMYLSLTITPIIISLKLLKINQIKFIMAYSSVIHSSWMISISILNMKLWMTYYIMYSCTLTILMMFIIKKYKTSLNKNNFNIIIMSLSAAINMMGLPPLPFILPKILFLMETNTQMFLPIISLLMSTAISLIFYSRFFTKIIYLKHPYKKIYFPMYMYKWITLIMWVMYTIMLILLI